MSSIAVPNPATTNWVPVGPGRPFLPTTPSSRVVRSTNQTIATTTSTNISFNALAWDTDNMWNAGSPTRLTCKTAGKYLVSGHGGWVPNAAGFRQLNIWKNGGYWVVAGQTSPTAGDNAYLNPSGIFDLQVGDYVELNAYQTSGGNLDMAGGQNYSVALEATYLGVPGTVAPTYSIPQPVVNGAFIKGVAGAPVWSSLSTYRYPSPPPSPLDGDLWCLPTDGGSGSTGVNWMFRYNAGSSSVYKWEFVGGPAVEVETGGSNSTTVAFGNFADLGGPTFAVLRAGDYEWTVAMNGSNNTAGQSAMFSVSGTGSSDAGQSICYACLPNAGTYTSLSKSGLLTNVSAGGTITVMYCAYSTGTATFDRRTLLVRPRRIS